MIKTESFTQFEIKRASELRKWLEENHSQTEGIWLITYKKQEKEKYVSREEVLDELICFGWIDGIRRKLDQARTMQLITPRRAQHWAKTYKERANRLIQAHKMSPAGFEAIKQGKESGLWNFMDDVDKLVIPPDLKVALNQLEGAFDFFNNINDSSKRFVLRWIKLAKTAKTRKSRIVKIAKLSSIGEKLPGS